MAGERPKYFYSKVSHSLLWGLHNLKITGYNLTHNLHFNSEMGAPPFRVGSFLNLGILGLIIIGIILTLAIDLKAQPPIDSSDTTTPSSIIDSSLISPPPPLFDFADSLKTLFLSKTDDLCTRLNSTTPHNPADLMKFNPAHFGLDYLLLPYRRNVLPFSLPGQRSDMILGGGILTPMEHSLEPDGLLNWEDIPLAPISQAYSLDGPLGMAFGGDRAVHSLIMEPVAIPEAEAESRMFVDKGSFGYANTQGVFSSRSQKGQTFRAALEYRKVDRVASYRDDDAYHQWWDIGTPVRNADRLESTLRLYRRQGTLHFRPGYSSATFDRFRRDRDFSTRYIHRHAIGGKSVLEFRHQRSESVLENSSAAHAYNRNLDIFDNSLDFSHERRWRICDLKGGLSITQYDFHDGGRETRRRRAALFGQFVRGDSLKALTGYLRLEKLGGYNPAPSIMAAQTGLIKEIRYTASLGYAARFPNQYELDLRPKFVSMVSTSNPDYFESGNSILKPEKQAVGNISLAYGKSNQDWQLSLTGGRILDAIVWDRTLLDTLGDNVTAYRPSNRDMDFIALSLSKNFRWRDFFTWHGAAAWRYMDLSGYENPAYHPDWQIFSSLELYHYVRVIDVHFYGYLEGTLSDSYATEGLMGSPVMTLGEQGVLNARLSFRIKKFNFYFNWQDLLNHDFRMHEGYYISGRLFSYGLTWQFID